MRFNSKSVGWQATVNYVWRRTPVHSSQVYQFRHRLLCFRFISFLFSRLFYQQMGSRSASAISSHIHNSRNKWHIIDFMTTVVNKSASKQCEWTRMNVKIEWIYTSGTCDKGEKQNTCNSQVANMAPVICLLCGLWCECWWQMKILATLLWRVFSLIAGHYIRCKHYVFRFLLPQIQIAQKTWRKWKRTQCTRKTNATRT